MASNVFWGFLSDENDRSMDRSEDGLLECARFLLRLSVSLSGFRIV